MADNPYRFGDPRQQRQGGKDEDRGDRPSPLSYLSELLIALGFILAIGAVFAAIGLGSRTGQSCSGSGLFEDCTTTHPYSVAAWTVGIGGIVQALLMIVVGLMGSSIERVRIGLARTYAEVVNRPATPPSIAMRPRPDQP